jgi:hypothetical protein
VFQDLLPERVRRRRFSYQRVYQQNRSPIHSFQDSDCD